MACLKQVVSLACRDTFHLRRVVRMSEEAQWGVRGQTACRVAHQDGLRRVNSIGCYPLHHHLLGLGELISVLPLNTASRARRRLQLASVGPTLQLAMSSL